MFSNVKTFSKIKIFPIQHFKLSVSYKDISLFQFLRIVIFNCSFLQALEMFISSFFILFFSPNVLFLIKILFLCAWNICPCYIYVPLEILTEIFPTSFPFLDSFICILKSKGYEPHRALRFRSERKKNQKKKYRK